MSSLVKFIAPLRERDGDDCWLCRELIDFSLEPGHPRGRSVDHVRPRIAGGQNVLANIRLAHRQCNERRGAVWNGVDYDAAGRKVRARRDALNRKHLERLTGRAWDDWSASRHMPGGRVLAIGGEPVMPCS